MKLIRENINEVIKHLSGRSEKEIRKNIQNLTDEELFNMWDVSDDEALKIDIIIYSELIRRNAFSIIRKIQNTFWYINHKDKLPKGEDDINEGIKHLRPRSNEEIIKLFPELSDSELYKIWSKNQIRK